MVKRKQIALLTQYYPPETGAASNRMRFFTEELCNHFESVAIFTAFPNYPTPGIYKTSNRERGFLWSCEKKDNLTIFRCRIFPATSGGVLARAMNFISLPVMLIRWINELRKYDIFIVTSGPMFTGIPVYIMSYFRCIEIILDVRDLWPERLWETGASNPPTFIKKILKRYERWMYSRCTGVITVTQSLVERLRFSMGENNRLYLVRNTDQLGFRNMKTLGNRSRSDDKLIVVEAGTQGLAQNPEILCKAISLLDQKYPGKVELRIAGSGVKIRQIEEYSANCKFIHYVGNLTLEELDEFLQLADVGVAALSDASINKLAVSRRLFDYARNGLAIVLSGTGEGGDILKQTGAGVAVDPKDQSALELILESLLLDKQKLSEFKDNSKNLLNGEFGKQAAIEQFNLCINGTICSK